MKTFACTVWLLLVLLPPAASGQGGSRETTATTAARAAQGAAAMEAGRFDEAAAIYAEVVASRPRDAGLLMNLGMARYMAGQPAEAAEVLKRALAIDGTLAPASLFLGASLLDLDRAREALAPLQRAVAALPKNPDARDLLARANLALERHADAATHYRALTELQAENPKAWYGLARSYEGIAERAFTKLQETAPGSPLVDVLLADVLVAQQKYPEALAIYRAALDAKVPVGGLHEAAAAVYELAGKPDWAAAERAKAPRPSASACTAKPIECDFLAGRTRQALAAARRLATAPGLYWTVRAANSLATEALAALESLPPSIELHLIRAEIAQARGRHTDAVTELKAALAMRPGDPDIRVALAESLAVARNFDEALPLLQELRAAQPDSAFLLYLLGNVYLQSQQVDTALPLLEQAVQRDPALVGARAALGRAYSQAGRLPDAIPHLEASLEADTDGSLHLLLGRAYQATSKPDQARAALEQYKKLQQAAAPAAADRAQELTPP